MQRDTKSSSPQARVDALEARRLLASVAFPNATGVVSIQAYGATPDDDTDDTAAIQAALNANVGAIVFVPDGVYYVSDQINWPGEQRNTTLWGQSRDGAVLKLKPATPGYASASAPRPMIWTGERPAQRFKNYIRNLTLNVGSDNPGAIGARFIANNIGSVRDVLFTSDDGGGYCGLDLGYTDEQGPCLIQHVEIRGFDFGIRAGFSVDSITMEDVTLSNQRVYGLRNNGQVVSIRKLHSVNAVPAIHNVGNGGLVTLIDSTLTGLPAGAAQPAIINEAKLFARNLSAAGYALAIDNVNGTGVDAPSGAVTEFVSHQGNTLWAQELASLNLPIKETPVVPWEEPSRWVSIDQFGATPNSNRDNDAVAIQAAIDSGARTVYIPMGEYRISTDVRIRGNVERIIGLGQSAKISTPSGGTARFFFDDGTAGTVVVEFLQGVGRGMVHNSGRTLVLSNMHLNVVGGSSTYSNTADGTGDVFFQDVGTRGLSFAHGQRAWARQLNTEPDTTKIAVDNATFWVLGLKTERGSTVVDASRGSRVEVLGHFAYTTTDPAGRPWFINHESSMSVVAGESHFKNPPVPYTVLVRETRDGVTRELRRGDTPARGNGSFIPLYVGRAPAPPPPQLDAASDTGFSSDDRYTADHTPTFTGAGADGTTIRLFADGAEVGAAVVSGGVWSITSDPLPDGPHVMTTAAEDAGHTGPPSMPTVIVIDTAAPTASAVFDRDAAKPEARFTISEPYMPAFAASSFMVTNLTTGLSLAGDALALVHDASAPVATLRFRVNAHGVLPDGEWLATLAAHAVIDRAGNAMLADAAARFHALAGDADGDRAVGMADRSILAAHWQQTGRTFSQGDFNYDGAVDVADLGILATNWQANLTAPAAAPTRAALLLGVADVKPRPGAAASKAALFGRKRVIATLEA